MIFLPLPLDHRVPCDIDYQILCVSDIHPAKCIRHCRPDPRAPIHYHHRVRPSNPAKSTRLSLTAPPSHPFAPAHHVCPSHDNNGSLHSFTHFPGRYQRCSVQAYPGGERLLTLASNPRLCPQTAGLAASPAETEGGDRYQGSFAGSQVGRGFSGLLIGGAWSIRTRGRRCQR